MKWAFVDFENVGSLEAVKGSDYARVFVFCGPKNTKINLDDMPSNGTCRLELIRVTTTGSNNLDFHLAFYLGKFHQSVEPEIAFEIISNDKGFNGLVKHLKTLGRSCKKVPTKPASPKQKSQNSLNETFSQVVKHLKNTEDRHRPGTEEKLLNWIDAHIKAEKNGMTREKIYESLKKSNLIEITDDVIIYQI